MKLQNNIDDMRFRVKCIYYAADKKKDQMISTDFNLDDTVLQTVNKIKIKFLGELRQRI